MREEGLEALHDFVAAEDIVGSAGLLREDLLENLLGALAPAELLQFLR